MYRVQVESTDRNNLVDPECKYQSIHDRPRHMQQWRAVLCADEQKLYLSILMSRQRSTYQLYNAADQTVTML